MIDYLTSRLDQQVSLESLSELVDCSTYYLIRLFKKHIGMSSHAFLVQLRLENGRRMLSHGVPIADAAFSSGFSDQSHFTRQFKNRYGVTPGQYQKQLFPC